MAASFCQCQKMAGKYLAAEGVDSAFTGVY